MFVLDESWLAVRVSSHYTSTSIYFIPFLTHIVDIRVTQIKTYSWDNAQVILVGNKCDMEEERVVSTERGMQLAEQLGVEFYETSAKENIYVKVECLTNIILIIRTLNIVHHRCYVAKWDVRGKSYE